MEADKLADEVSALGLGQQGETPVRSDVTELQRGLPVLLVDCEGQLQRNVECRIRNLKRREASWIKRRRGKTDSRSGAVLS